MALPWGKFFAGVRARGRFSLGCADAPAHLPAGNKRDIMGVMKFLKLLICMAVAIPAWAGIVDEVRAALAQNNFSAADSDLSSYRAKNGVTPEYVEAYSWMARAALNAHEYDQAAAYAKQTNVLAVEQLMQRPLDAEPHLPIALGAAIEVQSQCWRRAGSVRRRSQCCRLRCILMARLRSGRDCRRT
jgi:hypothetical protein